jgi:hypothetical protein
MVTGFSWIAATVAITRVAGWQVPLGVTIGLIWAGLLAYPWRRNKDLHFGRGRILRRLAIGTVLTASITIGTIILFEKTKIIDFLFSGNRSEYILSVFCVALPCASGTLALLSFFGDVSPRS